MPRIVSFEFSSDGPFGAEAAAAYAELADDIAGEDGLIWKFWTEDPGQSTAGGAYLFADEESAERYIAEHTARLGSFGITEARVSNLAVNEQITATTFGPLTRG